MDLTADGLGSGLTQGMQEVDMSKALTHLESKFLYEVVENHIIQFDEVVHAAQRIKGVALHLESTWTSWSRLQEVLRGLGFQWQAGDMWHKLGLSIHEGPAPTLSAVEQRWDMARFMLKGAEERRWLHSSQDDIKSAFESLRKAKDECMDWLRNNKVRRNKLKGGAFGIWHEAGKDLLEFCLQRFPNGRVGLQLSDVHNVGISCPLIMKRGESRSLHETLIKGIGDVDVFFNVYGGQHYSLWAPGETDSMLRMMGSLSKLAIKSQGRVISFSLFLPFKAPPCVSSFEDVTDLFSHPLLGNKWDDIIEARTFLIQPGAYTFSGEYGPITSSMSFMMVTVGTGFKGEARREILNWKASLATFEVGQTLLIDFPSRNLFQIQKVLAGAQGTSLSKPVFWEQAGASRGNTKDAPRSCIRGFLPRDGTSELEARMVNNELQKLVLPLEGLVGRRSIFQDKSALLAEITSWEALQSVQPLCEDIVALSPKWALLRTGVRADQWTDVLSNVMRNNPYDCILRVQWRQSYQGGRPWATPAATSQQIQAVRVQAKSKLSGGKGKNLVSTISIEGNLGPNPTALIRHMMNSIQGSLGFILREVSENQDMDAGDWVMCLDPCNQLPSGRIRARLSCTLAAKELENAAHNRVVNIGGDALAVKVCNFQAMALPRCQGNVEGAPDALLGPPPGL